MKHELFLALGAVAAIGAEDLNAAIPKVKTKPNILLILTDDQGWGDLSCQGAEDLRTPNIDRLFEGGVRLDQFHSSSNVSSPSRAGLLTGCYPIMVGVPGVIRGTSYTHGHLSPDAVLLPQMLSKVGYSTAAIGKWHLGLQTPNLPNDRGFDYFAGFLGDMMNSYYTYAREGKNYMRINRDEVHPKGHATEVFSDWAIDYIEKAKDEKNPFFMYLAYNAPHDPLQPPIEWLEKVVAREPGISETRSRLVALIEHLDYNIGRVLETLEKTRQLENTIVIFTSDNGGWVRAEANCGPHRGWKGDMYEGGISVPCAVYWKGRLAPKRLDNLVMMTDVFPTLCNFAGVEPPHAVDGISVLPLLRGEKQETDRRFVFWAKRTEAAYDIQAAVRFDRYVLLRNSANGDFYYYDLVSDPMQQHDLSQNDAMYKELQRQLKLHLEKGNAVPWKSDGLPPVYKEHNKAINKKQ